MKRYKKGNILYDLIIVFLLILGYLHFDEKKDYLIYLLIFVAAFILLALFTKIISKQKYKKRLLSSGLLDVDQMDGVTFEHFLSFMFRKLGYTVTETKKSHDFGADLILKKDGRVFVLQAKKRRDKVGINAVQEVLGAKYYYKADKALVMTNSFFTRSAVLLAQSADIDLLDRNALIDKMNEINGKQLVQEYK